MRCRACAAELLPTTPHCPHCGQPTHLGDTTTEIPTLPPPTDPWLGQQLPGPPVPGPPPPAPPFSGPPSPPPYPGAPSGPPYDGAPSGAPYAGASAGPPYPGAPSWPVSGAGPFPYPVQPRRRRPWLLLVVLLVVGVTGVVGIGFAAASTISSPGPSPRLTATGAHPASATPTTGSASGQGAVQASAMNDLLTASGASRAALGTAISQVQSCDASSDPLSTMDGVIRDRTAQLRSAQALAVDGLPGGESLRGVLVQLLQKSAEADGDYEAWAQQVLDSACAPGAGAAQLTAASTASSEATTLKKTFLTSWNPIASRYGLPQRQETDL
jgi:hypothetical protein